MPYRTRLEGACEEIENAEEPSRRRRQGTRAADHARR
jgi:hypothetical protein